MEKELLLLLCIFLVYLSLFSQVRNTYLFCPFVMKPWVNQSAICALVEHSRELFHCTVLLWRSCSDKKQRFHWPALDNHGLGRHSLCHLVRSKHRPCPPPPFTTFFSTTHTLSALSAFLVRDTYWMSPLRFRGLTLDDFVAKPLMSHVVIDYCVMSQTPSLTLKFFTMKSLVGHTHPL